MSSPFSFNVSDTFSSLESPTWTWNCLKSCSWEFIPSEKIHLLRFFLKQKNWSFFPFVLIYNHHLFRFWPLYISVTLDCSYTTSDEQSQLIWVVFSLSLYRSLHLSPTLVTFGAFLLQSFWLQTGWKEHRCLLKEYPGTTILL